MNSDFCVLLPQWWRDLLHWILNGGRVYLGDAYNNAVKRRDCITFSDGIGNNVEK